MLKILFILLIIINFTPAFAVDVQQVKAYCQNEQLHLEVSGETPTTGYEVTLVFDIMASEELPLFRLRVEVPRGVAGQALTGFSVHEATAIDTCPGQVGLSIYDDNVGFKELKLIKVTAP